MLFRKASMFSSHEGDRQVAVPRGLHGAPLRPASDSSWGGCWRLEVADGLSEACAVFRLFCPLCGIGCVVPARACVGITLRKKILRGPGAGAVGETHVAFPVKGRSHRGGRLRVI